MKSLGAVPAEIIDVENATAALLTVLPELDAQTIRDRLTSSRDFIYLHRYLTPSEFVAVHRLGIPGFEFRDEPRRIYPHGALTSHVVGYTEPDGHGLAGVELSFDEQLAAGGDPLVLSLDIRVQHILREQLAAGAEEFQAIGASGMVLDVDTGEVLAMVSLPDFEPSESKDPSDRELALALHNRNTLGVYEMGSVFKIFNTSMILDAGLANLSSVFDASRPLQIDRFTIHDFHAQWRPLNVAEILLHSSNIGSALMARLAGAERQRDFMRQIGMLDRSPVELPDASAPILPEIWGETTVATVAFGHGLAVTPIQVVSGYAAVANGGHLVPATILRRDDRPIETRQVISAETSHTMRRLLRMVVHDGSQRAEAEGYIVGGKTGTAEKSDSGTYSENAVLSSFIGVFPMNAPRYVVLVTLDEPKGNAETHGFATAGWVSAPVVSRVVARIGPLLGIAPVDPEDPAIVEDLRVPVAFR